MNSIELPDITKAVYDAKEKGRKIYPCHSNRASELGHPCMRYLVYNRINWNDKALPSVETQFIFDAGNVIEKLAKDDLEKAGFEIVEQQRPYEMKDLSISGYIDFKLRDKNGFVFPCEVKGLNDNDTRKLNCIEDFLESGKVWLMKYPAQLTIYMLLTNSEYGCFYIKSKPSMKPKHIWIHLDYTFAESLLQKAEKINKFVAEKKYPDPIEYNERICGRCPFSHLCLQPIENDGANFIDSAELEEKLQRREELKAVKEEYENIDDDIKGQFKEIPETFVGKNWRIFGKEIKKIRVDTKAMPAELRKPYENEVTEWRTTIQKI